MPIELDDARARREAGSKRRRQQDAEAPLAMAEYRAAEQAARDRMFEQRRQRLARDAALKLELVRAGQDRGRGPGGTSP
jgi:hypothetical protein